MKTWILTFVMWPAVLWAGVTNGGGGKAIVCRGPDRAILTAQVLDLFEAENQYGLELLPSASTFDENLRQVGDRLEGLQGTRAMFRMSIVQLKQIFNKFKFLAPGVGIQPIDDSMDLLKPEGCEVEQLAFFKEANVILVNQDIWSKLDPRNKAALVVHEAIYQHQRRRGAQDSRDSRKIVGHLFSTAKLENTMGAIPRTGEAITCGSNDGKSSFYVSLDQNGNSELTFSHIEGLQVFSKTSASYSGDFYRQLLGQEPPFSRTSSSVSDLATAIPHRSYDRVALQVHPAPADERKEFITVKIAYLMMDEMFEDPTKKYIDLYCYREIATETSISIQPLKPDGN